MKKEGTKQFNYLTTEDRIHYLKIAALSEGLPANKFLDKLLDAYKETQKGEKSKKNSLKK